MMKKSRMAAVLVVCVMMFGVVQPACAWWGEDAAYGGFMGGGMGAFVGAFLVGAAVVATGGLAALPAAGGLIAAGAQTGATYGAVGGAAVGAIGGKRAVDNYTQNMAQGAGEKVSGMTIDKKEAKTFLSGSDNPSLPNNTR